MNAWKKSCASLAVVAGLTPVAWAQAPAPLPVGAAPVAAVAAPVAQPTTLWSFLGLGKGQLAACKEKFCQTQLGLMVNNASSGFSTLSGGLIPQCCPGLPTPADLAKPGAEGAAAKVKADEADAAARRAAVRYLGTVSCHYWPEAEAALIAALRTDRNECVRWEAAAALANGCCCTKKTVAALAIAASGSERDDNPSELSERVRAMAMVALQHCISCYVERREVPPAPPVVVPGGEKPITLGPRPSENQVRHDNATIYLTAFYVQEVERRSSAEVIEAAKQVVTAMGGKPAARSMAIPTGSHTIFHLVKTSTMPIPAAEPVGAVGAPMPTQKEQPHGPVTPAAPTGSAVGEPVSPTGG